MNSNYEKIAGGSTYTLDVTATMKQYHGNHIRLLCETNGGAIAIQLPKIADWGGAIDVRIMIDDVDDNAATNNITVLCDPTNTIENAASFVIKTDGGKIEIYISNLNEYGVLVANGGIGGSTNPVIDVTYKQLSDLRAANSLVVGQKYKIIDFAQSYNIFDGVLQTVIEEQIGILEPIIVTADSSNSLNDLAISTVFPNDEISYSLNILDIRDIAYGNGVDTVNANFKGQIHNRIDKVKSVEMPFDFRNIKSRRFALDAVQWVSGNAYVVKDIVKSTLDGKLYKCIDNVASANDPSIDSTHYVLFADIVSDPYIVSTQDASVIDIGDTNAANLIVNPLDYRDYLMFEDYKNVSGVVMNSVSYDLLILQSIKSSVPNIVFRLSGLGVAININLNGSFCSTIITAVMGDISASIKYSIISSPKISASKSAIEKSALNCSAFIENNIAQIRECVISGSCNFNESNYGMVETDITTKFEFNHFYRIGQSKLKTFQHNIFLDVDFYLDALTTSSSHVAAAYTCTIYTDKTDGIKLTYMDAGIPQYVNAWA